MKRERLNEIEARLRERLRQERLARREARRQRRPISAGTVLALFRANREKAEGST